MYSKVLLGRQCKHQFLRNYMYEQHCFARRKDENREYEFESCRDVVFLNQLKHAVEGLGLGVHYKVKLIAGNVMSTLVGFIG